MKMIFYRFMDVLEHLRHNLHRLNEVSRYFFDEFQIGLFGQRYITSWVPVHNLGIEYVEGGKQEVLKALVERLSSNPSAVYEGSRETELTLADFVVGRGCVYASMPAIGDYISNGAASDEIALAYENFLKHPTSIYLTVGVALPGSSLEAHIERCSEVFNILLDHGFDPYKECSIHDRYGRGASFVERWERECVDDAFCRAVFATIDQVEAKKRGAHLDEVLPPVVALEAAPTLNRARL